MLEKIVLIWFWVAFALCGATMAGVIVGSAVEIFNGMFRRQRRTR